MGSATLRNPADFEFEKAIAHTNRRLSKIETVFLLTAAKTSYISSSIVRDVLRNKGEYELLVPAAVRVLLWLVGLKMGFLFVFWFYHELNGFYKNQQKKAATNYTNLHEKVLLWITQIQYKPFELCVIQF